DEGDISRVIEHPGLFTPFPDPLLTCGTEAGFEQRFGDLLVQVVEEQIDFEGVIVEKAAVTRRRFAESIIFRRQTHFQFRSYSAGPNDLDSPDDLGDTRLSQAPTTILRVPVGGDAERDP